MKRLSKTRANKTKDRGVSPIIATILLVAITVVLAAVLYILVSVFTHVSAPTIAIGFGTVGAATCTTAGGATINTYVVSVASTSDTLQTSSFGLKVENASSATVAPGTAGAASGGCPATGSSGVVGGWAIVLQSAAGTNLATFDTNGWTALSGSTLPLAISGGETLEVVCVHPLGQDSLIAYPSGSQGVTGQESL